MPSIDHNAVRRLFAHGARTAIAAAFILAAAHPATARPLRDGEGLGVARWPDNTVINVWIPPDPAGKGRDTKVGDGVLAWNDQPALTGHGISIKVHYGVSPGGKNDVSVSWHDGVLPDGKDGSGSPSGAVTGHDQTTSGGKIVINQDPAKISPDDAKGFGTHEMGHILGLDDSEDKSAAMNESVSDKTKITKDDISELGSVYTANGKDTKIDVIPTVKLTGGLFHYTYDATWQGGGSLAMFQITVGDAVISSMQAPTGWVVDDFAPPSDVTLDYAVSEPQRRFVGFVLADGKSYLGPDFPTLEFSLDSNLGPGYVKAYLNGAFTTLGPVPEPGAWTLMIAGFALVGLAARRRTARRALG